MGGSGLQVDPKLDDCGELLSHRSRQWASTTYGVGGHPKECPRSPQGPIAKYSGACTTQQNNSLDSLRTQYFSHYLYSSQVKFSGWAVLGDGVTKNFLSVWGGVPLICSGQRCLQAHKITTSSFRSTWSNAFLQTAELGIHVPFWLY